jgi:hypothetical protein
MVQFPNFCTKDGLLTSLRAAGIDVAGFVPRSYLSTEEMDAFALDYHATIAQCNASSGQSPQPQIDCGEAQQGALWIAKPAQGTRGVGIRVFSQLDEIQV